MCHALNAWREPIRPLKAYPILMDATNVPQVDIQRKKATRNRRNVKSVLSGSFKICPATPRAVNVQLVLATKPEVPRLAMLYLLVRTVGMAHFEHVIQVNSAKVKPPIKPLAYLDPMPPTKDPLPALNAHPERMPTLLVPKLA